MKTQKNTKKTKKSHKIAQNRTKSHKKLTSMMSTSPVAAHSPRVALEGSIQNAAHSPSPAGTLILASIRPVRKLIGDFDLILEDVYHLSSTGSASRSA